MKNNLAKINLPLLFLVGMTVLSFGLGWWSIRHYIYSPFARLRLVAVNFSPEEQLKILTQDTDKDGLTDLEEQSIKTSAYLADSDSDDFSDKEEVDAGSNPLDPSSTPQNKIASQEPVILEKLVGSAAAASEKSDERGLSELSPSEIRKILVEKAGLSPEIVDKVDDKTLIELYNETKKNLGFGINEATSSNFDISKLANQFLRAESDGNFFELLTGAQIRQILIEAGADKKMLDSLDDGTLKQVFLEAIKNK